MVKVRQPASAKTKTELEKLEAFENGADKDILDLPTIDIRQNATRKYKSITMPFNYYEFERLAKHCEKTGIKKQTFIRQAINAALELN